jgi:AcrR family transcriptional regulator
MESSPPVPALRRRYRSATRAAAAAATRQRILDVARHSLQHAASFDDVSLEQIAERAGIALKTVQRHFGSKAALLVECGQSKRQEPEVTPGDIAGVAHALAARYEASMDVTLRYLAVEARVPAVAQVQSLARASHWRWLEQVFAPYLPARRSRLQRRRVAQLFAATELYSWYSWRRRLSISRDLAEQALTEMLAALVASWHADVPERHEPSAATR